MKTKWNQMIGTKLKTRINLKKIYIKKDGNQKNQNYIVWIKQMKWSLCTLPKREERKGGGGKKNLPEPHRMSSIIMRATH